MPTWVQKVLPDGRSVFVPKEQTSSCAPMIAPDIEPYTSPVDGRLVDGRKQRREDLKRTGCVEYDPGMKRDALRNKERAFDRTLEQMVDRMRWYKA